MNPSVTEEEVDKFLENIKTMVANEQGEMVKIEKWGKRPLAYEVKKNNQGYYILLWVRSSPAVITELERRFKISDSVIKFSSVLAVEDEEKMKGNTEKMVGRMHGGYKGEEDERFREDEGEEEPEERER